MGYDTVTCSLPLPDAEVQHLRFQTTDLGSGDELYVITADGRLVKQEEPNPQGFAFYTTVGDTWYEYYARLSAGGVVERIERVYIGPASERYKDGEP